MFQILYKSMIKHDLLILRLHKDLEKNIELYVEKIKNTQNPSDIKILVATGVKMIPFIKEQLIFHTPNINKYETPIEKDTLLFEFVHRQIGKKGRNLKGEIIALNSTLQEIETPKIKDESIYSKKENNATKFYSAQYGFLFKDDDGFHIKKNIAVSYVSTTATGSIVSDIKENISVEVLNYDITQDSVKSGKLQFQANNVKVQGSVGATEITAKNITIKGTTHADSLITAKQAFIKIHKRTLKAEVAHIKILENGRLEAKDVFVEQCTAATIIEDYICIRNMILNCKIYPSKILIVEGDLGDNNAINIYSALKEIILEEKDSKILLQNIETKLKKTLETMQTLHSFLVKHQAKVINAEYNHATNTDENKRVITIYYENLSQYKKTLKNYQQLIKEKFQVLTRLKELGLNKKDDIKIILNVKISAKTIPYNTHHLLVKTRKQTIH